PAASLRPGPARSSRASAPWFVRCPADPQYRPQEHPHSKAVNHSHRHRRYTRPRTARPAQRPQRAPAPARLPHRGVERIAGFRILLLIDISRHTKLVTQIDQIGAQPLRLLLKDIHELRKPWLTRLLPRRLLGRDTVRHRISTRRRFLRHDLHLSS